MNKIYDRSLTDQQLLERFHENHDNAWLGILLERYLLLLFGVCMKYLKNEEEARDSVQQIVLKAITELQKYQVAYFRSWIYAVARNHCLMQIRSRKGKLTAGLTEGIAGAGAEDTGTIFQQEKERLLDLMTHSLQHLNPEQKQCLTLFYLEQNSYQQISEKTGFSLSQVKSYIQNGKRNLRIMLDRKLDRD